VLLYHATQDQIVSYSDDLKLAGLWCNASTSVTFVSVENGGHVTTEIIGLPDALDFTAAAFAGTIASGCSNKTELNSYLNPLALAVELEPLGAALTQVIVTAGKRNISIINNILTLNKTVL
jgi:hypothetical protein